MMQVTMMRRKKRRLKRGKRDHSMVQLRISKSKIVRDLIYRSARRSGTRLTRMFLVYFFDSNNFPRRMIPFSYSRIDS